MIVWWQEMFEQKWEMRSVLGNVRSVSCPPAKPLLIVEHIWSHLHISWKVFVSDCVNKQRKWCSPSSYVRLGLSSAAMVDITREAKSHKIDLFWWLFVQLYLFVLGLLLGLSIYQVKGVLLLRLCTDILGDVTDGSQEIFGCVTESREWIGIPQNSWKRANQAHHSIPGKAEKSKKTKKYTKSVIDN